MFRYRIDESLLPLVIFDSPGSLPPSQVDQDSFCIEVERADAEAWLRSELDARAKRATVQAK